MNAIRKLGLRLAAMFAAIALAVTPVIPAQQTTPARDSAGTVVSGDVYDSIQAAPIAGAVVQMVSQTNPAVSFTAMSDSAGHYRIAHVPAGKYILGFVDEALAEVGFTSIEGAIDVGASPVDHVTLAVPGPQTVYTRICGPSNPADSSGAIVGFVRDASTETPLGPSTVVVVWREITIDSRGLHADRRQLPAKTAPTGWFAICGLPADAALESRAELGARATGFIEITVPLHGVTVRDFDIGDDTATASGRRTAASPLGEPMRHGTARLTGIVRDSSGRALEGAHVTLWGSATATTDANGRFDLRALPSGTGTIESQYIGFEPVRRVVNLAPNRTDTIRVVMTKAVVVLAGTRVYGKAALTRKHEGFDERRKTGQGHYYTDADIAKARPLVLTDFFYMVPGVRVQPESGLDYELISTHGAGMGGPCSPAIWVDGVQQDSTGGLNQLVQPGDVSAIEVYDDANVPPLFRKGECGAVVIWTK